MAKKLILFILLFSVFEIGITLRINNLDNIAGRSADEKIYTQEAKAIVLHGWKGIKLLIQKYNLNKELWIYPPPIRVGYLWLLAGVMKMTNSMDEKVGTYISCTFSIISLLLLIILGLRFFNPWITLYALLFMGVSPMDLAIARRAWQDAMLGCIGLSLIYFCCEITRNTRKIIWYILFIVVGSYCLLIKESGMIIYGLCLLWLLWILFVKERSFLKGFIFMIVSGLGAGISLLALAYAAGGIKPIIAVLTHVKEAMPTNAYAIQYQSGPWYYFLQGFWIISPLNASLCVFAIVEAFLGSETLQKGTFLANGKNPSAIFGIILFMITFMTITILAPYCQNLRYVSVLFVPFYLMAGLGLFYIASFIKLKMKNSFFYIAITFTIAIILMAARDYQNFQKIFVRTGIVDVSIRMVKQYSR
jgi:hypothetical protein